MEGKINSKGPEEGPSSKKSYNELVLHHIENSIRQQMKDMNGYNDKTCSLEANNYLGLLLIF